jgi:hypothetical protein
MKQQEMKQQEMKQLKIKQRETIQQKVKYGNETSETKHHKMKCRNQCYTNITNRKV